MENLEANSKSIQPETQNTEGNKTSDPEHSVTINPGDHRVDKVDSPSQNMIKVGEHKLSNSASVSNPPTGEHATNHLNPPITHQQITDHPGTNTSPIHNE